MVYRFREWQIFKPPTATTPTEVLLGQLGNIYDGVQYWALPNYMIDQNTRIVAVYEEVIVPTYSLTISATAGGTTSPPPGVYTYNEGFNVQVVAIPSGELKAPLFLGYVFDHWELDGISYTQNPINVTMNTNHSLTAFFREEVIEYGDLTVTVEGVEPTTDVTVEVNTYVQSRIGPGPVTFMGIYAKSYTCTVVAEGYTPKSFPVTVVANQVSEYLATLQKMCAIATVAYGTPLAPELYVLRRFRDRCLPNPIVALYYSASPPMAEYIRRHMNVRRIVREALSVVVNILRRS